MLGKKATRAIVEAHSPDALIIASGGIHHISSIPGIHNKNVLTSKDLHERLWKFLRFLSPEILLWGTKICMPIGKRVAIIGGQIQGSQLAEFLVKRGRKVIIVDEGDEIGKGLPEILIKPRLIDWLEGKGVQIIKRAKLLEITGNGLNIQTEKEGKRFLEVDNVLTALPLMPNENMLKEFNGCAPEIHAIGDCKTPGLIVDAIHEGFKVGINL